MSVTVMVEPVYTGRYLIEGYKWDAAQGASMDPVLLATFPTYDAFWSYIGEGKEDRDLFWIEFDWYGRSESITADAPYANMSNYNAHAVLTALGLDTEEMAGRESATKFRERVLLTMAAYNGNDAVDTHTIRGEQGATIHHMGRPEGYVAEKLARLLEVAETAEGLGLDVVWS